MWRSLRSHLSDDLEKMREPCLEESSRGRDMEVGADSCGAHQTELGGRRRNCGRWQGADWERL